MQKAHENKRFNIIQSSGHCSSLFVIIEGKRTPGGYACTGAIVRSLPMTRENAVELADYWESVIPE